MNSVTLRGRAADTASPKPARSTLHLTVLLVATCLFSATESRAQGIRSSTLAAANLRIIPEHHHLLWMFNDVDDLANPRTGFFISFYLNTTGNFTPETLSLPAWINPGPGGYLQSPTTGVMTGGFTSRPLAGGWTAYTFAAQIRGASTRIWDASRMAETAQGSSTISLSVSYALFKPGVADPLSQVSPFIRSVLGPAAHQADLNAQGIQIRDFTFAIQANGSGRSLSHPGQTARWTLSNAFLTSRGIAVGQFNLSPR